MFDKAKDLYQFQKKAKELKKELKNTHIQADEDGVTITISAELEVLEVNISEEAAQDREGMSKKLEKALNKAIKKAQQIASDLMKDNMGNLNFPGLT